MTGASGVRYDPALTMRNKDAAEIRLLAGAAGLLAAAVLADSAIEHYRGSFRNPAMFVALGTSSLGLGASVDGARRRPGLSSDARRLLFGAAATTGAIGTGFHIYNLLRRPGRLGWRDFFYGAPIGAPAALILSGLSGLAAESLRSGQTGGMPQFFGLPAGRTLAGLAALGLCGTVAEAALLHFRGSYQNPFMLLPVSLPPVAAGLLARVALRPGRGRQTAARQWLRLTALLGLIGPLFHSYGVHRAMGGWRNWRQNVLNGPPLPAPPGFTGLAMVGLAALRLIERRGA
jgi:hypothetical protein